MSRRVITADICGQFRSFLVTEERAPATVEKYMRAVAAFAAQLPHGMVTKESVIAYMRCLQGQCAARSVNSTLAGLNRLFSFLGWQELRIKALRLQKRVYCPEEKELTRAEYLRLCSAAAHRRDRRLCLVLQTICSTGIRVSELQHITVEAAKRGEAVVTCKAKTRSVFIVSELKQKLLRYAAEQGIESGMLFVTRTGRPVNRTNIWRAMKSLCAEAQVPPEKVFPHNLRHLFARTFYQLEKDIAKLADLLGHSSIQTTRLYIISTGMEHRRRMEHMHLLL